jgi:hypothetical protein
MRDPIRHWISAGLPIVGSELSIAVVILIVAHFT